MKADQLKALPVRPLSRRAFWEFAQAENSFRKEFVLIRHGLGLSEDQTNEIFDSTDQGVVNAINPIVNQVLELSGLREGAQKSDVPGDDGGPAD